MKREIEALLFATDNPMTMARLKKLFPETESADLRKAIGELGEEYERGGHAFAIVEFGGGWQISTRSEYSPIVEKMLKGRRFTRLSKAGLEVLAIIAYRQPLTRLEVDDIRGVNSSGALSTLSERNLITVVGRSQNVGNPLLYGTTREFLNHLGLKGLGQLPDLPDLESMIDDQDELKKFAAQVGRDVSDEDFSNYFEPPEKDTDLEETTTEEMIQPIGLASDPQELISGEETQPEDSTDSDTNQVLAEANEENESDKPSP